MQMIDFKRNSNYRLLKKTIETKRDNIISKLKKKWLGDGRVVLGIDDCGGAKTGQTTVARIVEEWRLLVSGLGIDGGGG